MELEKESKVIPDACDTTKDLYSELRNAINSGREDFRTQLTNIKEMIATRTQELESLEIKKLKLEGAIEASDIYLKVVLPSNNN